MSGPSCSGLACQGRALVQYLGSKDRCGSIICSATMDLKVVCVIICLCALAITSTEAAIPKCCFKTTSNVSVALLRNVTRVVVQSSTGACDIDALLLYKKGSRKPICASIKMKRIIMKILKA